ncbi:hypothetical protein [Roseospirillum parvum]|uniref:Uncharacterized protein n=1 Tax=Roseospirillum parvum TaxID=83401 RepID=A0A1G8GJM9_9PROT|nr:hypothetical protein [Roseospirillum parvum]SDH94583.1 hypothetical protein SAMN05421742_1296 [Roseospirillum parvum]
MTRAHRKHPRPGRYLPICSAAEVPEVAKLESLFEAAGWRLQRSSRPYRRRDGRVSVRLIWRRRGGGAVQLALTYEFEVWGQGHG